MKQIKCFGVVSSLHSYIVEYSHQKTLLKTLYFMGVPIEDEVNEVFWWCRVYIHTLWNIATGKYFRKPFTLRPCLWEKTEVKCLDENK